jgi:hypothetical protein
MMKWLQWIVPLFSFFPLSILGVGIESVSCVLKAELTGKYDSLDMTMHDYCTKVWPSTPKASYMRVNLNRTGPDGRPGVDAFYESDIYLCENTDLTVAADSAQMLVHRSMTDFVKFLDSQGYKVLYLGDSLTAQMWSMLLMNLREDGSSVGNHASYLPVFFLGPVPDFVHDFPPDAVYLKQVLREFSSVSWTDHVVDNKFTHVVINTGAWFSVHHFKYAPAHQHYNADDGGGNPSLHDLIEAYEFMFRAVQSAMVELKEKHGVVFIWRDLTAAGVCHPTKPMKCPYSNHKVFTVFNAIGRKAVLSAGGVVLPNIYTSSLGSFADHARPNDVLHWCYNTRNSVPSYWNSQLFTLLEQMTSDGHGQVIGL